MKHSWNGPKSQGVQGGCGRPHGVDTVWTCKRCGAQKAHGPANTCTGKRVMRWSYLDRMGYERSELPACRE